MAIFARYMRETWKNQAAIHFHPSHLQSNTLNYSLRKTGRVFVNKTKPLYLGFLSLLTFWNNPLKGVDRSPLVSTSHPLTLLLPSHTSRRLPFSQTHCHWFPCSHFGFSCFVITFISRPCVIPFLLGIFLLISVKSYFDISLLYFHRTSLADLKIRINNGLLLHY